MVQTLQIVLFTIDDVKRFVTLTNKYHFPINLSNGKYKIDAKSIMGIFSLDLSKPINLNIHAEGSLLESILKVVEAYVID